MKSTERKVVAGSALLLGLLIGNAVLAARSVNIIQANDESVSRTQEMLLCLETTFSLAKDAETGTRGFIITGDDSYLEPYRTALSVLPGQLNILASHAAENPKQAKRVVQLRKNIDRKLALLEGGIKRRRQGGLQAIIANIGKTGGRGKQEMDSLRFIVQQMGDSERDLLETRLAQSKIQLDQFRVTFALANLAACLMLGMSVWAIMTDLAARRRAENEIMRSRELLQVTLDSIGDAVITTDREGKVTFMNPVAELMTGWRQNDARGVDLETVFRIEQETTRAKVDNPALRAIREGIIVGLANHTILVDRQGNERHIDDSGAPIKGPSGEIEGAVLVFHDITSRREVELQRDRLLVEERHARSEAEAANLAKDQFIAVLSHELRTPIQPILGWVQLLTEDELTHEAKKVALETIERNVRLQARLIEDILDLSRIATGKIQVTRRPLDLVEAVRQAVHGQKPAAESKSLELNLDLPEEILEISGDPDRIHQVVWNLLGNAVKFTPKGGRIDVRLRKVNSNAEIEVRDDGQGIEASFLPHVFERFRQSDSSSTRLHGGLGIGLTIVRQIVELHGGTVTAESEGNGLGSTFRVSLPVAPVRAASSSPNGEVQSNGKVDSLPLPLDGLRLLVVEDEPDSLHLILTVLKRNGAVARGCPSAKHGHAALDEEVPDVLISDIGMPGEDGFQFMRKVRQRAREEGGKVPAIALTAFTSDEDRRAAMAAGFNRHLAKPIEPWDLVEAIAKVAKEREA